MKSLCAVLAVAAASAMAQTPAEATVQALLVEVRQLRQALEKSTVVVPKIQMTLQRIQLQQESVSRVSRELETVRGRLAKGETERAGLAEELRAVEAAVGREQDASRKTALQDQMRQLKAAVEQPGSGESQLRANEAELSGRLRVEQSKLDEMSDRLNALERMLDTQPR